MSKTYPQFLLFGDSIIQQSSYLRDGYSFGAVLAEHCSRRFDVINRGLSGYNTANALVVLEDIVPKPEHAKVAYMLVLFGANDACVPHSPSKQHVPLKQYEENIKTILAHPVVKAHDPIIFLVTPSPVNETQLLAGDIASGYSTLTRYQSVTAQYADAVRKIAGESKNEKVILIDLHSALMKKAVASSPSEAEGDSMLAIGTLQRGDSAGLRSLLVDGLHLTGAGYQVFIDEILPFVETPPFIFPVWTNAPRIDRVWATWS